MTTGSPQSRLVIVRGPSGSGKSTVAAELRRRMGRGTALVEQDYVRRRLLWEKDTPGAVNIGMLDAIVRHCLGGGYDVVLEGILLAERYGDMLRSLIADHAGTTVCAYLDVPFEETVRRHASRPQAAEFTTEDMARWWAPYNVLGVPGEIVVGQASSMEQTVTSFVEALTAGPAVVAASTSAKASGRGQQPKGRAGARPFG